MTGWRWTRRKSSRMNAPNVDWWHSPGRTFVTIRFGWVVGIVPVGFTLSAWAGMPSHMIHPRGSGTPATWIGCASDADLDQATSQGQIIGK